MDEPSKQNPVQTHFLSFNLTIQLPTLTPLLGCLMGTFNFTCPKPTFTHLHAALPGIFLILEMEMLLLQLLKSQSLKSSSFH